MLLSKTNKKSKLKQQLLLFWLDVCFLVDYGIYQNLHVRPPPLSDHFLYPKHPNFPSPSLLLLEPFRKRPHLVSDATATTFGKMVLLLEFSFAFYLF